MQTEALCRAIGKWFQTHKNENPFAFGEVHLLTGEEEAEILLIIGKPEEECQDPTAYENQWEGTIYDAPVTWLWQKLADGEADEWLRTIYDREAPTMKRAMLVALLELFRLIEGNGYTIDWEADGDEPFRTRLHIDPAPEPTRFETDRWNGLLSALQGA
ncbi:MAG: hypothetical protein HQL96_05265 [Magnetococcales bacterium]|nr:hypothetical protein [Magnetococcales bacterium]